MKHLLLAGLFLSGSLSLFAQINAKKLDDSVQKARTMDSKANFASILGALGSFAGKDGSNLTFQPTFYGIASLFNPDLKKSGNFRKEIFIRNSQLTLGLTPAATSLFKYDSLGAGYTYAIINNKKLTAKKYRELGSSEEYKTFQKVQDALAQYAGAHIGEPEAALALSLFNKGIGTSDLPTLPKELRSALNQATGAKDDADLLTKLGAWDTLWQNTISALSRAPLFTAGFNSIYDLVQHRWQEISLMPVNLTLYMRRSNPQSSSVTITGSYVFDVDTANKENLQRNLIKVNLGYDIIALMTKDKKKTVFEIKPGLMTSFVTKGKYLNEKTSTWNPSLTLRARLSDNFYLPVTLKYDTKDPQLFGFLAIQYSFN
ncbi:MAG TPA: hypothetical protein VGM30_17570 [Puia sp.]|jgi:hypothetical protein